MFRILNAMVNNAVAALTFVGVAPISKMVEEKDKDGNPVKAEKADPHGIQVRKK